MARPFAASVLALTLLAGGVPDAAQRQSAPARRSVAASPAITLERIQAILLGLDAEGQEHAQQAAALTAALALADGRLPAPTALATLADTLVTALAPAFVDDEIAERLAYDLYAMLATKPDRRELSLLVADITGLLRQAGVDPQAGLHVLRQIHQLTGLPAPDTGSPESARSAPLLARP